MYKQAHATAEEKIADTRVLQSLVSSRWWILEENQKTEFRISPTRRRASVRPHEYLVPLKKALGCCKRCARRSTPCLKCGYCYLCHPYKEYEEEAEIAYQAGLIRNSGGSRA